MRLNGLQELMAHFGGEGRRGPDKRGGKSHGEAKASQSHCPILWRHPRLNDASFVGRCPPIFRAAGRAAFCG